MNKNMKNIKGKYFGRLRVIKIADVQNQKGILWLCRCECGNLKYISGGNLRGGYIRSCGCLRKEVTAREKFKHGEAGSRLYKIWANMKSRCYNPNDKKYRRYGKRKIKICDEWQEYIPFKKWATANGYNGNLSIDRIDNDGDYMPSNCQWMPRIENSRKWWRIDRIKELMN